MERREAGIRIDAIEHLQEHLDACMAEYPDLMDRVPRFEYDDGSEFMGPCLRIVWDNKPRVKVVQDGMIVGTLPRPEGEPRDVFRLHEQEKMAAVDWTPSFESTSVMTQLRAHDLTTEMWVLEDGWKREIRLVASPTLGPGDLDNIKGFRRVRPHRA